MGGTLRGHERGPLWVPMDQPLVSEKESREAKGNFRASNMTGSPDALFFTFVVGSHGREDIACVLLKK